MAKAQICRKQNKKYLQCWKLVFLLWGQDFGVIVGWLGTYPISTMEKMRMRRLRDRIKKNAVFWWRLLLPSFSGLLVFQTSFSNSVCFTNSHFSSTNHIVTHELFQPLSFIFLLSFNSLTRIWGVHFSKITQSMNY